MKHPIKTALLTLGLSMGLALASNNALAFGIDFSVSASNYQVTGSESANDLLTQFAASTPVFCNQQSLSAVTNLNSSSTCGTGTTNLAYLTEFEFNLDQSYNIDFRIGTDWGRGGGIISDGALSYITNQDIWWNNNWNNSDVITTSHNYLAGQHLVQWVGYEGCCNGSTSIQFSVNGGSFQDLSLDNFSPYNSATSVPVPAPLALFGLGLLGLRRLLKQR